MRKSTDVTYKDFELEVSGEWVEYDSTDGGYLEDWGIYLDGTDIGDLMAQPIIDEILEIAEEDLSDE